MVVRIHNLGKWRKLEIAKGKQVLQLPGHGVRKVLVHLNCAGETRVDLVEVDSDDARATFLWAGRGMQEIEFTANGLVQVVCTSSEDVYYFTNERGGTAIKNVEAVSFTKIANRRARNPELDAIMLRAEINMNRRLARLEQEMERKYGNAARRIDMNTGEVTDVGAEAQNGDGHSAREDGSEPDAQGSAQQAEAAGAASAGSGGQGAGVPAGASAAK